MEAHQGGFAPWEAMALMAVAWPVTAAAVSIFAPQSLPTSCTSPPSCATMLGPLYTLQVSCN